LAKENFSDDQPKLGRSSQAGQYRTKVYAFFVTEPGANFFFWFTEKESTLVSLNFHERFSSALFLFFGVPSLLEKPSVTQARHMRATENSVITID
jgi:hypothetical protein